MSALLSLLLLVWFVVVLASPLPRRRGRPPGWLRRLRAFRARLWLALVRVLLFVLFVSALVAVVAVFALLPVRVLGALVAGGGLALGVAVFVVLPLLVVPRPRSGRSFWARVP